ncbi:hypothetical protein RQP46_006718 [Phenoliferia psychrophenolica]
MSAQDVLYSPNAPPSPGSSDSKADYEKGDSDVIVTEGVENPGGAPTEARHVLGQQTGWVSVIFLNINQIIGTGVFATGGTLLKSLGSPGLVLVFWLIGMVIAFAGLSVYMELSSQFPNRAGAEVVYLEQAYKRPKYFFPAAFACLSVLLSFSSSNAIVLATYLLYAADNQNPSEWLTRGVAIAGYTVATLCVAVSTKWSLRLTNLLGIIKTITLVFIVITGFVVLGGHTRVKEPHANFKNAFEGSTSSGNAIANAIVKLNFSFANAMNVMNEIPNPVKTLRWAAPLTLSVVSVLYILANVAYFAAVPAAQIKTSGTLVAALFFTNVFGENAGSRVLPALVAVSAFGNLIAVLIGQSRVVTVIAAPPIGDAFNFVVDLQSYPSNVFNALTCAAVFILRRQRRKSGASPAEYQAWNVAVIFSILISLLLLIMPWIPPSGGINGGDVSFFYAAYCAAGIGLLLATYLYWLVWIKVLPRVRGYTIQDETVVLEDGFREKVMEALDAIDVNTAAAHFPQFHRKRGGKIYTNMQEARPE